MRGSRRAKTARTDKEKVNTNRMLQGTDNETETGSWEIPRRRVPHYLQKRQRLKAKKGIVHGACRKEFVINKGMSKF